MGPPSTVPADLEYREEWFNGGTWIATSPSSDDPLMAVMNQGFQPRTRRLGSVSRGDGPK